MEKLESIGVTLNFATSLIGFEKQLVSQAEVLSKLDVRELEKISGEQLRLLYCNDWTKDDFQEFLIQIGKIDENRLAAALKIWQFAFLNDIVASKDPIETKLDMVASWWAFFDYTPNWSNLINYMPPENGVEAGITPLYERITSYVKNEKGNLFRYLEDSGLS